MSSEMNRRDVLKSGVMVLPMLGLPSVLEMAKFTPIDKRLSGKIFITDLQEGESGYTWGSVIAMGLNQMPYFCAAPQGNRFVTVWTEISSATRGTSPNSWTWIGRHGDDYYVAPNPVTIKEKQQWHKQPNCCGWITPPAMLAYCQGYPLDNLLRDGLYKVPVDWKVCAKHPTVAHNITQLNEALALAHRLRTEYGMLCSTSIHQPINDLHLKTVFDV